MYENCHIFLYQGILQNRPHALVGHEKVKSRKAQVDFFLKLAFPK